MTRARSAALLVVSALLLVSGAVGFGVVRHDASAGHSLVVPAAWRGAWQSAHVREGRTVALAWGDRLGDDPRQGPADLRFDATRAVAQLDALYSLDVDALRVVRADGPVATHKILVVVDGTWSSGPAAPGATLAQTDVGGLSAVARPADGTVTDGVGVLRTDAASLRGSGSGAATEFDPSWDLARAFAEVVQGFGVLDRPGSGFASDDAKTFWPVSAAYLASLAAPGTVGGLADLIRAPQLHWGSARLGEGGWLLLQYLAERDGDQLVGDLWQRAEASDDPLATYRRVTGLSQDGLARRVTEYAMRTVTWDFADNSALAHAFGRLDPALLAERTTPVAAVAGDPGHYAVLDTFAPSDYGFDVVRLQPDGPLATIRMHLAAHGGTSTGGLSFGFVAVRGGIARYSPVTTSNDAQVQFQLRAGETDAYLVVTGTPQALHSTASTAGVGDVPRYPYDFRLDGASVDDRPVATPAGMHRHANGGGLVDDRATVDPTAFVGPDAVVRGDAHVLQNARIEGRAWVEGGAVVTGDAVVRDAAVVRSGSHLDAGVVVGGDAVVQFTCSVGTYLTFDVRRGCDGSAGRPDINPVVTPFDADRVAITGPTEPGLTPTESPSAPAPPSSTPSASSPAQPTASPTPTKTARSGSAASSAAPAATPPGPPSGGVAPPEPVQSSPCQAQYTVNTTWTTSDGQHWFQAQVRVTGTGAGVKGWQVGWVLAPGVQFTQVWNANLGANGRQATAENEPYNGTVRPGEDVVFGFEATAPSEDVGRQVPSISCTPTR
jgi:hypothetical protein